MPDHNKLLTTVHVRFYGDLNIFLKPRQRHKGFAHTVKGRPSIKDTVEALGVPHTQIDALLVNGRPVNFDYQLKGKERIRVYPDSTRPSLNGVKPLKSRVATQPKFICDVHLGTLARYLRLLGFDCVYEKDLEDQEIIEIATRDRRVILTRDIGMLKNKTIRWGYFVRHTGGKLQIKETVRHFRLKTKVRAFSRCLDCNGRIRRVAKHTILHRLEPLTQKYYHCFYLCRACGKVYWQGSHYEKLDQFIARLKK